MISVVVPAPLQPPVRTLWLPRVSGQKLSFSEAPARMALAVGLGWSGKAVMMSSPVFGKLFFIPLALGAIPLGLSGLLLVSGPAKVVIDKQSGNVKRRRRGIRLPGTTNQALHLFEAVAVVRNSARHGGWSARMRSTMGRWFRSGRSAAGDRHDDAWEVHLVSSQSGVAPVVLSGFGPDRHTAEAVADKVAEFTGLSVRLAEASPAPADRAA